MDEETVVHLDSGTVFGTQKTQTVKLWIHRKLRCSWLREGSSFESSRIPGSDTVMLWKRGTNTNACGSQELGRREGKQGAFRAVKDYMQTEQMAGRPGCPLVELFGLVTHRWAWYILFMWTSQLMLLWEFLARGIYRNMKLLPFLYCQDWKLYLWCRQGIHAG